MSIATKTGDKGETSLLGGERLKKSDVRLETYGTLDELNASIGVVLAYVSNSSIKEVLSKVQNDLFTIGAGVAALTSKKLEMELPKVTSKHLDYIEESLNSTEESLPKQTEFILPKGTKSSAHLHLARTICRRAERRMADCNEKYPVNSEAMKYLNRLGDLLFLYARKENTDKEEPVKYDS